MDRHPDLTIEQEIIAMFWNRDEKAVEAFASYDNRRCYQTALGILDDTGYAEECVNDLYLKLWNSIPPEKPASLRAYACRIVQNLALNILKKQRTQKRSAILVELDECVEDIPERNTDDISELIDGFLASQPKLFAMIFMRRYFYSDTVRKIAEITGLSEKKVSRILSKMRKELRKALSEGGVTI